MFDLNVHEKDPKTGVIIRSNPYRLRILKQDGVVKEVFERDGKFYDLSGNEVPGPLENKPQQSKPEVKKEKA